MNRRSLQVGCTSLTTLYKVGKILSLTSDVPLHWISMFISLLFRMTEAAGISVPKLTMTIFLGQVVTTVKSFLFSMTLS